MEGRGSCFLSSVHNLQESCQGPHGKMLCLDLAPWPCEAKKKKSMGREETKVTATWCSNEKVRIRLLSGRMLAKVIFKVLIFLIVQVRLCCLVMSEPKHPGRAELSYPKMFAESPVGGAKDMGRRIREKDSQVLTILVYIWSNVSFSYFNPEFPLSLS